MLNFFVKGIDLIMELTVLGCWAPYPRAGGACSGYLVRSGGLNIMLEAGNGTLSRLMGFIDFRSLDLVVVSHLHHDHYLDLFALRHAIEGARIDGSRTNPLPVLIPCEPEKEFNVLAGYVQAFTVSAINSLPPGYLPGGLKVHKTELGGLTFCFAPVKHPMPGFSVAVEGDGKLLVFSADTARTGALETLAAGADLFLCEASGKDNDAEIIKDKHLTATQAGEIAGEAGVKKLILTHFWPEYDPGVLCQQAKKAFSCPVEAAREGNTYQV